MWRPVLHNRVRGDRVTITVGGSLPIAEKTKVTRLVSAAPELFEALQNLRTQAARDMRHIGLAADEIEQELSQADAALKKARGE